MNPHQNSRPGDPAAPKRGAAFYTVILFTFIISALIVGVLNWSLVENRMTGRTAHVMQARNAAEALCEYGLFQVQRAYTLSAAPSPMTPGSANALTLPPSSFWESSSVNTSSLQLEAPTIGIRISTSGQSGSGQFLVDSTNQNNAADPLSGQWVTRLDIPVFASATVTPPEGGASVTAYVSEVCEVRGSPVFSNAVFYGSNDMEIQPGPTMNIAGPVHVNGNLFVSSQSSGSSVNFEDAVSITGNLYHAWATTQGGGEEDGGTLGQNPVTFLAKGGTKDVGGSSNQVNLDSTGSSTGWKDSTMGLDNGVSGLTALQALITSTVQAAFIANAANVYGSNLQTGADDVPSETPIAFNEIIGSTGTGTNATSIYPNPHSIIDPPVAVSSTDTYATGKEELEKAKLANQAGLFILVTVGTALPGTTPAISYQAYGAPGSAAAMGVTNPLQIGPNLLDPTNPLSGGLALNLPSGLVQVSPFNMVTTYTYKSGTGVATVYTTTTTTTTSAGSATVGVPLGTLITTGTQAPTVSITGGMIDQRRYMNAVTSSGTGSAPPGPPGVDLININMGGLTATGTSGGTKTGNITSAVSDMVNSAAATDPYAITYTTSGGGKALWAGWNGGVYVDVSAPGMSTDTNGQYSYSNMQAASVRLINGQVASGSSLMPSGAQSLYNYPGGVQGSAGLNPFNGITVATNAPVYVLGNYNADGSVSSASATTPDDGKTDAPGSATSAETPAYIAGDAITILSPGWQDKYSYGYGTTAFATPSVDDSTTKIPLSQANTAASSNNVFTGTTGNVEIAAAMLTGITPTGAYSTAGNVSTAASMGESTTVIGYAYSGGVHNLPRFLEDFNDNSSGNTVAIRGSLTNLYASEVASQPWYQPASGYTNLYYSAPVRQWGFDDLFKNGVYPPMAPTTQTFRRGYYYDDMSSTAYNAAIAAAATGNYY